MKSKTDRTQGAENDTAIDALDHLDQSCRRVLEKAERALGSRNGRLPLNLSWDPDCTPDRVRVLIDDAVQAYHSVARQEIAEPLGESLRTALNELLTWQAGPDPPLELTRLIWGIRQAWEPLQRLTLAAKARVSPVLTVGALLFELEEGRRADEFYHKVGVTTLCDLALSWYGTDLTVSALKRLRIEGAVRLRKYGDGADENGIDAVSVENLATMLRAVETRHTDLRPPRHERLENARKAVRGDAIPGAQRIRSEIPKVIESGEKPAGPTRPLKRAVNENLPGSPFRLVLHAG